MKIVVAGVGFVGLATARGFHAAGWEVVGVTHSPESAARLASEPFRVIAADLAQRTSLAAAAEPCGGADVVIHCASSGHGGADAYRAVYLEGARNIQAAWAPRRLIFTSSTSVYAQTDGSVVTEESLAQPTRETGRILLETEAFVLAQNGVVARLAGIYGPGRSVLLRKFFHGEAVIEGDGGRLINQIHRDDIASALLALAERGAPGIYNVCDSQSLTQRDLYAWLAQRFSAPLPPRGPIDPNRKRGWTSKAVSNAKLRALGWAPRFPTFYSAVEGDPELVALARTPAPLPGTSPS